MALAWRLTDDYQTFPLYSILDRFQIIYMYPIRPVATVCMKDTLFIIAIEQNDYTNHPSTLVKFSTSEIHTAFQTLTGRITDILAAKDFKKLRRACYQEIRAPTSTLPESLVQELKPTKSLDDMLDVLALSPYWNWFDTRLLQALVNSSGSPEAEAMLE